MSHKLHLGAIIGNTAKVMSHKLRLRTTIKKQSKSNMSNKLSLGATIKNRAKVICLTNYVWEPQ